MAISTSDAAHLKRSYERNLGHFRFWAGVGTALLGGLLLFIANTLWAVGRDDPGVWSTVAEISFSLGILVIAQAMVVSFSLAWIFREHYRLDDRALAKIEQDKRNDQKVT